jgi:hypothetical protein
VPELGDLGTAKEGTVQTVFRKMFSSAQRSTAECFNVKLSWTGGALFLRKSKKIT